MKSKILLILIPVAIMLASCSKDDPKDGPIPEIGEESVVRLTIYDATAGTRAAGTDTEPASGIESTIDPADGIKVIVFNENGSLAYPTGTDPLLLSLTEISPGSGTYRSDPFKLISGDKYFYIFANDRGTPGTITTPSTGMSRLDFIAQSKNLSGVLDITTPNFLMGTLWSEKKEAPRGGTQTDPKNIPLTIGRLASKVKLTEVSKGSASLVNGTFTDAVYRLGSIPKKIFIVGNNDENLPVPPANGHGVVKSALHEAPYTDPDFERYSSTWKSLTDSIYTVENTTAPDASGTQYYGNTSYIQIRTVYTPDVTEVAKVDDLTPKGSFTGPTFYTAKLLSNGVRLIFEDDPRTAAGLNPNPDIDQSSILVYGGGENYHKFPIHDPEAGLPDVQKNAVLRNHFYGYKVTSIADIGSPVQDVDPDEPIETETTLRIEVIVAPWSKIENTDVPI